MLQRRKIYISGGTTVLCGYVLDCNDQVLSIKIDDGMTICVPNDKNKVKGYISIAVPTTDEMYLAKDGADFEKPIYTSIINFNFGMERFYRTSNGDIKCLFGTVVNKGSRDSVNGKLYTYVVETWDKGKIQKRIIEMNADLSFKEKYKYLFITKNNTVQDVL